MPTRDQELANTLPFRPGMVIASKYRVLKLIAAGGMGAVLEAHHEVLDQRVAIKLMRPEIASNTEAAQRFLREARAAARIESDFVARVTDVDMWEDTPFMVMEFLQGSDLEQSIDSDQTLTVSDAVDYVMQSLAGLHAAHTLGVIHRDLKPSNLFLVSRSDGQKRVKILDFGISKVVGDESDGLKAGATTSTEAMLGTPRYMSPEQVSSAKDVDVRTDLWAMGLILYELLTKSYPFEGDSAGAILAAILTSPVPPARDLRRDVPKQLDQVIARLLSKKRDDRYPTAKSVMRALAPFASRRVQALLLDQDELQGALAATETLGTPSTVLSSGPGSPADANRIAMAATAISNASFDGDEPSFSGNEDSTRISAQDAPGGATETSMSVAGVPKKQGGATRVLVALGVAAAVVGVGVWFMQSSEQPGSSAIEAPTTSTTVAAAEATAADTAATPTPSSTSKPNATIAAETTSSATPTGSATASAATATSAAAPDPAPRARTPRSTPRPPPPTPTPEPKKPKDLLNDWD